MISRLTLSILRVMDLQNACCVKEIRCTWLSVFIHTPLGLMDHGIEHPAADGLYLYSYSDRPFIIRVQTARSNVLVGYRTSQLLLPDIPPWLVPLQFFRQGYYGLFKQALMSLPLGHVTSRLH